MKDKVEYYNGLQEEKVMADKQIIYIEAGHIRPHPENPRKDLEDL